MPSLCFLEKYIYLNNKKYLTPNKGKYVTRGNKNMSTYDLTHFLNEKPIIKITDEISFKIKNDHKNYLAWVCFNNNVTAEDRQEDPQIDIMGILKHGIGESNTDKLINELNAPTVMLNEIAMTIMSVWTGASVESMKAQFEKSILSDEGTEGETGVTP